jgi:hypothetical protein
VGTWILVPTAIAAADLEIARVWPEKLLYAPDESAKITVTITNAAETAQRAQMTVTLATDLAEERELWAGTVDVEPGAARIVSVTATLTEEFGHEVAAVLERNGREISRAREFFTVTDHAPLVSQYSFVSVMAGTDQVIREQTIPGLRRNYVTMAEIWMWSPSSFCDFAPQADEWWGNERYTPYNRTTLETYIEEAHKNGMKVLTYINHGFWGGHAWEILREHPEWAMYLGTGQWYARFDAEDTGGQPDVVPEDTYKMAVTMGSFVNMSAVDKGTDALIAGAEMWGFDGARWDGQWAVSGDYGTSDFYDIDGNLNPRYPESDHHAVRNAKRYKSRLKEARPGFLFGYNYGVRFKEGAGKFLPGFYQATVGDRGWLLWETAHPLLSGTEYGGATWDYVYEAMKAMATPARDAGGEMYAHAPTGTDVFNAHMCAMVFAHRGHFTSPTTLGHWYKFALRYGGLLYGLDLEVAPATGIEVEAGAPLWWEETVYRRTRPGDREQLIIHLINPPADPKVDPKMDTAPDIRNNIQVSTLVPDGSLVSAAWVLSPDPDTHASPLTVSLVGGRASTTVPELAFWDVVVFEFDAGMDP